MESINCSPGRHNFSYCRVLLTTSYKGAPSREEGLSSSSIVVVATVTNYPLPQLVASPFSSLLPTLFVPGVLLYKKKRVEAIPGNSRVYNCIMCRRELLALFKASPEEKKNLSHQTRSLLLLLLQGRGEGGGGGGKNGEEGIGKKFCVRQSLKFWKENKNVFFLSSFFLQCHIFCCREGRKVFFWGGGCLP